MGEGSCICICCCGRSAEIGRDCKTEMLSNSGSIHCNSVPGMSAEKVARPNFAVLSQFTCPRLPFSFRVQFLRWPRTSNYSHRVQERQYCPGIRWNDILHGTVKLLVKVLRIVLAPALNVRKFSLPAQSRSSKLEDAGSVLVGVSGRHMQQSRQPRSFARG